MRRKAPGLYVKMKIENIDEFAFVYMKFIPKIPSAVFDAKLLLAPTHFNIRHSIFTTVCVSTS
jgi:hypothetical protein